MPPISAPIIGMMRSATSEDTIFPKAVPMITPTARSTTLPLIANSRNSFSQLTGSSCSWIGHFKDLELLLARRRAQPHHIACARLDERSRDRRHPRHAALRRIDLVDADDGDGPFPAGAFDAHACAEKHLIGVASRRVDDLRSLQALDEKAHAPVDLTQPALAVDVVGVLRAIAERRRPGHRLHHLGALELEQLLLLALQTLET